MEEKRKAKKGSKAGDIQPKGRLPVSEVSTCMTARHSFCYHMVPRSPLWHLALSVPE